MKKRERKRRNCNLSFFYLVSLHLIILGWQWSIRRHIFIICHHIHFYANEKTHSQWKSVFRPTNGSKWQSHTVCFWGLLLNEKSHLHHCHAQAIFHKSYCTPSSTMQILTCFIFSSVQPESFSSVMFQWLNNIWGVRGRNYFDKHWLMGTAKAISF